MYTASLSVSFWILMCLYIFVWQHVVCVIGELFCKFGICTCVSYRLTVISDGQNYLDSSEDRIKDIVHRLYTALHMDEHQVSNRQGRLQICNGFDSRYHCHPFKVLGLVGHMSIQFILLRKWPNMAIQKSQFCFHAMPTIFYDYSCAFYNILYTPIVIVVL